MNPRKPSPGLSTSRRGFCRQVAFGLVSSFVGAKWFVADVLANGTTPGQFTLNLADYPTLDNANGSVVLALPGAPSSLATVVITRVANGQFFAVDSTCAHNQCEVPAAAFNAGSQQMEITCSCHASRYKATGELLGGPAQRGLRTFTANLISPAQLRVDIPEFRFTLGVASAQPVNSQNRLRLTFPALSFLTYHIHYRPNLQASWTPVNFSRFPTGPLNQTDYPGIGAEGEVYVAAPDPAGFFAVAAV